MGVVFSGMFGFGIVLITKIETDVHLDHILFGNMLGVSINDVMMSFIISCLVTLLFILKWRDLLLCSFDETHAIVSGLKVKLLQFILLASMTLTIVATLKALGLILSISLIIAPGAIAFLINNRFRNMMIIAVFVSLIAMLIGIYSSFWIDSAPAPTVILVLTMIFIFVFILKISKQKKSVV
jgi:manganese/iron transport system permease protein